MNKMEKAALQHVKEELEYQRSKQAKIDLENDIKRRNKLTIKQGHSLKCGILKCHPECPSLKKEGA